MGEDIFEQHNHPNLDSDGLMNVTPNTNIITVNVGVYPKVFESTVENIQNSLGVHEFISHFKTGVSGDLTGEHWKAAFNQMMHSTFTKTTLKHKSYVHGLAAYLYRYGTGKNFSNSMMGSRMNSVYLENMPSGFRDYYK